jgi:predicted AlkP superfamily phosphohydrolase/phosphomutase/Tfp pilus assembly protein PilF
LSRIGRRALPLVLSLLLVAGLYAASLRTVPPGSRAVIGGPGHERVVGPGRYFVPPLVGRMTVWPVGERTTFVATHEDVGTVAFSYEVPDADLVRFQQMTQGKGSDPLTVIVLEQIRQAIAEAGPGPPDRSKIASLAAVRSHAPVAALGARLIGVTIDGVSWGEKPGDTGARLASSPASDLSPGRPRPVLLVGIDAADWTIIDRLRAKGYLPALSGLIERGASGPLRSIEPLLSPLIWTTIATGVSPAKHGILDFLVTDPATGKQVPATSRLRRAPAFWNLLSSAGKSAGVVGWLATWPAESIEGFVVTDRFGFLAFAGQVAPAADADVVYPPDLLEGKGTLAIPSGAVSDAMVRRYLDVTPAEIAAARRGGYEKGNAINNFIHTLASAESYAALGLDLYATRRPDVMAVYFEFVDATCHLFMPFDDPPQADAAPADARRFGRAVTEAYRRQDEMLGRFVELAGDSTLVIVVSDHGFRSGDNRLAGGADMEGANAARWHLPDGVIVLAGPGVVRGTQLTTPRVFDIAPTLLAAAGVPVPPDMEGRTLDEAFAPGMLVPHRGAAAGTAAGNATPGETADPAATPSDPRSQVNLGIVLAKEGKLAEAEAAFRRALATDPTDRSASVNLAAALLKKGDFAGAEAILKPVVARDPGFALGWANLANCYQRAGRNEEAITTYARAIALEPNDQRTRVNRGFLLLDLRRPAEAEIDFRKALGIAGRDVGALYGLAAALELQGKEDEARTVAADALRLAPDHQVIRQLVDRLTAPKRPG